MITVKTIGAIIAGITLLGGGTGAAIYFSQPKKNTNSENSPTPPINSQPEIRPAINAAPVVPAIPVDANKESILLVRAEKIKPTSVETLFAGNPETKNYYCSWDDSGTTIKDENCEIIDITFTNKNQTNIETIKKDTNLSKNSLTPGDYYKLKIHGLEFSSVQFYSIDILNKNNESKIGTLKTKFKISDAATEGKTTFLWGALTTKTDKAKGKIEEIYCKIKARVNSDTQCDILHLLDSSKSNGNFANLNFQSNNVEKIDNFDKLIQNDEYFVLLFEDYKKQEIKNFNNVVLEIYNNNSKNKYGELTISSSWEATGSQKYLHIN